MGRPERAPEMDETGMPGDTAGRLEVQEDEGRFKFLWRGRLFLAYNKGNPRYGDFYKSKPDFYPVLSPSGREVTTSSAYRYNHHHSLWIGHARANGVNFFHDNNPERPNLGDIVLEQAHVDLLDGGSAARVRTTNAWVAKDGRRVMAERRDFVVRPGVHGGAAHAIDLLSELHASEGPVELGQDTHAYLGVRVADTIDEEDGGRILNSNGQEHEAGCMRQEADWCDYSGLVAGQPVGVAIMHHPQNPPAAFFTRAYGTVLSNPTLLAPVRIEAGQRLLQRWRVLVHEGDAHTFELPAAYAAYRGQ
jgi:hypothetical protein